MMSGTAGIPAFLISLAVLTVLAVVVTPVNRTVARMADVTFATLCAVWFRSWTTPIAAAP